MIPFAAKRAAERIRLEALIASDPSPARFRTHSLNVLALESAKARELKIGGFGADWSGDCYVALPLSDQKPPESEKEDIEVTDYSGQTHRYRVRTVTPLKGLNCYRLALRPLSAKPVTRP